MSTGSRAEAGAAVGYGHGICGAIAADESYAHMIGDVKSDVTPNDEAAASYLAS